MEGYAVLAAPALGGSPIAVFCERFGDKTYLTIAAYLFGTAREKADEIRKRIEGVFDRVTSIATAVPASA